jgi:type VI protein secretion system component VasK
MWTLCAVFFVLVGAALAADAAPAGGVKEVLSSGSVQAVLAVCLLSVSAALAIVSRTLFSSLKERITALEKDRETLSDKAKAEQQLAQALDRMREHCEAITSHGPGGKPR